MPRVRGGNIGHSASLIHHSSVTHSNVGGAHHSFIHLIRKFAQRPIKTGVAESGWIDENYDRSFHDPDVIEDPTVIHRMAMEVQGHGPLEESISTLREKANQHVDAIYLVDVFIGTPPQKFRLQIDTGSSDLWVFSDKVQREATSVYKASQSSTALELQEDSNLLLEYEDGGKVVGKRLLEAVTIDDKLLPNQVIGVADYADPQFLRSGSDGVLGLALLDKTVTAPETHLKAPAQNFSPPIFVVKLESWRDRPDDADGSSFCTVGTTEDVPKNSIISYTPVIDNKDGFWKVDSEDIEIDGKTYLRPGNKAVIDTGGSLALVDFKTCHKIYAKIKGAMFIPNHGWIFPQTSIMPEVYFYVGGAKVPLHQDDIRYGDDEKEGYCYGGIQDRGHLRFDIFGDTFLKSVYAIFDIGRNRFGVAQRPERPSVTEPIVAEANEKKLTNGAASS